MVEKPAGLGAQSFVLSDIPESEWQPERLLKSHGLDPKEWRITRVRGSRWGREDDPNAQLRIDAEPIKLAIHAPDLTGWKPLPKPRRKKQTGPIKAMVISDHHAPRHEKTFHKLTVQRMAERQPDVIDVNGDLLDLPSVSRHRTTDEFNHSVNECLNSGMKILADYRKACPDATINLKRGNHCNRLEYYPHDNAPEIKGVMPGGGEKPDGTPYERAWHDLRDLLWLDELHVDYNPDQWEHATTQLSPKLKSRHGFSTSPNAGKIILDKLSGSNIQGHDHRLWMTLRTRHTGDPDMPLEVRMAMSGGCACEIPGGLGYVNGSEPDWQNAFIEATIYDDGDYYAAPAIYVPGRLLTSDGRYTA